MKTRWNGLTAMLLCLLLVWSLIPAAAAEETPESYPVPEDSLLTYVTEPWKTTPRPEQEVELQWQASDRGSPASSDRRRRPPP